MKGFIVGAICMFALSTSWAYASRNSEAQNMRDDDSVICAVVNVDTNRARWFIGLYREPGKQGIATYIDRGDHLEWSRSGVPVFVKRLARGEYGTGRIRARCKIA